MSIKPIAQSEAGHNPEKYPGGHTFRPADEGQRVTVLEVSRGKTTRRLTADVARLVAYRAERIALREQRKLEPKFIPANGGDDFCNADVIHNRTASIVRIAHHRKNTIPEAEQNKFLECAFNARIRKRRSGGVDTSSRVLMNWAAKLIANLDVEIAQRVANEACSQPADYICAPGAGAMLGLTLEECEAVGKTPSIHATDVTREDMIAFNRRTARIALLASRGEYRPRKEYLDASESGFYEPHGISRSSWCRWKRTKILEKQLARRGLLEEWHRWLSLSKYATTTCAKSEADAAPCAPLPEQQEDIRDMQNDADTAAADTMRPIVAPGDAAPDDSDQIPARHADDAPPIDTPTMGPEHACIVPAEEPSPAFVAAQRSDARARERGDALAAGQLLWMAAANASPPVPIEIREGDDDAALARHLVAMGHLTEAELAWIKAPPRRRRAA